MDVIRRNSVFALGKTDAMRAFLIDVQVAGDAVALQGRGETQAVLWQDGAVLASGPDKTGRSVLLDLFVIGQQFDQRRVRSFSD